VFDKLGFICDRKGVRDNREKGGSREKKSVKKIRLFVVYLINPNVYNSNI